MKYSAFSNTAIAKMLVQSIHRVRVKEALCVFAQVVMLPRSDRHQAKTVIKRAKNSPEDMLHHVQISGDVFKRFEEVTIKKPSAPKRPISN